MAAELLPEELVHDVLRYCILASPDTFLDPANDRSSFLQPEAPPSPLGRTPVLLVSKRWRRIATPLLFTSLWLSESAHTRTVARLFQENPHLGKCVLDLRLEGGYDDELCELVKHTPNAKNVFLSWNIGPVDELSGLLTALPSLSPESLYLGYQRYSGIYRWRSDELVALLEECIAQKWPSLVRRPPSPQAQPR
ncbi:hypothetical protein PHLGIDRAFT_243934 [Phlebiopsis gigantea 11061_1 CR5-6]|uniref:F-box domain-containing protein n=1 Tax=Phlebiopsis gigantea (strain 11061_1 CR5-6) TaxID=745531 RepID=A0A0C3RSJ2_PHLG1|nr:hypothetical protein PHLGIDRAFT_243934 [Phlebiopsis gigantea 11061_1 CR5-6]